VGSHHSDNLFALFYDVIRSERSSRKVIAMPTIALNRDQSRRVDQLAVEEYGFCSLVLMENAGRDVADVLCRLGVAGPVIICCGKGNNAGDGFVIARHLDLRGHAVRVLLWANPDELSRDAAANFRILSKTDVPIEVFGDVNDAPRLAEFLQGAAWIVDALLGTGTRGEPRAPLDAVIDQLNAAGVPIVAVDLPSGLDCDSGQPARHTIRATETCTFVSPKCGFAAAEAAGYLGRLHVLDIGVPHAIVDRVVG
jgi:NAD(P)H-hydrate epimerase